MSNPNITPYPEVIGIPRSLISEELDGVYGAEVLKELNELIRYYAIYERGAEFEKFGNSDSPAELRFKIAKQSIDKEARFLFSKRPDIHIESTATELNEKEKQITTAYQDVLDRILKANRFDRKLLQAAKDAFIAKRVAYFLNFNSKGVSVQFVPSLGFIYDTDPEDMDRLTKLIAFYTLVDNQNKNAQRIYRKRYWMADDGYCHFDEAVFNGLGELIEELNAETVSKFTEIPGGVILNDGLTGDALGVSEISQLAEAESWYSRLSSGDIDAMQLGMNPIVWSRDMSRSSTKNLGRSAGSFWDLSSDPDAPKEDAVGDVGILESSMNYSTSLGNTLSRIRSEMLDMFDLPDIRELSLKVPSGKALKAIYWGLIVRCDEKMLGWKAAIEHISHLIIEGVKLYPEALRAYKMSLPSQDWKYNIVVENQYPLPEDEVEEKQVDLAEVAGQTMSRKAYMKKWRGLTDNDITEELAQMAREREQLESGMFKAAGGSFGGQEEPQDKATEKTLEGDEKEVQ